jgi:anti-sigma-K factor RskA
VEAHVATCDACSKELDELQAVAALLGQSAAIEPPAYLRGKVLQHVDAEVQEQAPPAEADPVAALANLGEVRRARRWRALSFPKPALVAASVILALVAITQSVRVADLNSDLDNARGTKQASKSGVESSSLVADSALSIPTSGPLSRASAQLVLAESSRPMLLVNHVPQPPAGKAWQAWMIDGSGKKISLGTLPHQSPVALLVVPADFGDIDAIAITLERAGGADQPTSAPVAFGSTSAA